MPRNGSSPKAELSEIAWMEDTDKDNETNIYALIEDEDGKAEEVTFSFTRYQKP
jgi:hypothetical protein